MIDFGKLYCDLHPNQIITNFCFKETCMAGLCANCICTHTEYHVNNKTTPEYQNIRTTFSSMHQTIRKKIASLENQKNRIEKIAQFIQTKRKALKQNIEQTRTQAIAVVNNFFDNREKVMLRQMESEQKKMGLHSEARMQSLMNSLGRQTSLLITSAQQLNSLNFLESYQRIKTQTLCNATKLEEEITRQLDRNEDFETIINTNDEYIRNIMKVLEQSLQLTFKMNYRIHSQKSQQNHAFSNESSLISLDKISSRLGAQNKEKISQPVNILRPSSAKDSNVFSALSFTNMPEMFKQQTAKFNHDERERQTSKSIQLSDSEKTSALPSGRQNKSFINDLSQSQMLKEASFQSQIFRQKDVNGRPQHQSLNKCSPFASRNHQSQLIVVDNPFGHQSNIGWNNSRSNLHHQSMNQSFIKNVQRSSQEKLMKNSSSQLNFRNQEAINLYQLPRQLQSNMQGSPKFNFVPHVFEAHQFAKSNENQMLVNDCRKMRKSGLTLLKANSINPSLRTTNHDE